MTECGPAIAFDHWQTFASHLLRESRGPHGNPHRLARSVQTSWRNSHQRHECHGRVLQQPGSINTVLSPRRMAPHGGSRRAGSDGYLYIKVVAKSHSRPQQMGNIYPEEIEDLLNAQPYIAESLVIEQEGKLVALVYPDAEAMKQNKISARHFSKSFTRPANRSTSRSRHTARLPG